jgi:polysaccharide biosynthesis PFTS motif protein
MSHVKTSDIPNDYLFNYSNIVYRPLWTYTAESKGSRIIYYNWSSSFPEFLTYHGYKPTDLGEKLFNYPITLQWSKEYADYLQSIYEPDVTEMKVCSPICFNDSNSSPPPKTKPTILVFDVSPPRRFFHDVNVPFLEYRTYSNGKLFLEDIYHAAVLNGYDIVWKAKRNFSMHHHKGYISFTEKFVQYPGVHLADPNISAFKLVQNADIVVSMPFTSTALIAHHFNKSSFYYDPIGLIMQADRGRNGIDLISGREQLLKYIDALRCE